MHDWTVLKAFSPYFAGLYFVRMKTEGWQSLSGILLCFTGVEALFADLGAFSKRYALTAFPERVLCLTLEQCNSNLMALPYLPMPSSSIHRPSCIHLPRAISIRKPLLRDCAAGHVLSFACPLDPRRHRCFPSPHHQYLSVANTTHALVVFSTDQGHLHEHQVPRTSVYSSGELGYDGRLCDCHCRLQQCQLPIHHEENQCANFASRLPNLVMPMVFVSSSLPSSPQTS